MGNNVAKTAGKICSTDSKYNDNRSHKQGFARCRYLHLLGGTSYGTSSWGILGHFGEGSPKNVIIWTFIEFLDHKW